jgi:arylsulfatase A-like enzyme
MSSFRSTLAALWFRLASLAILAILFAYAVFLSKNRIQGWTFYLSTSEVLFEVLVRLVFAALVAMALAAVLTAFLAPFLLFFRHSREQIIGWITKIAVVAVIFLDSRYALTMLLKGSGRGVRFIATAFTAHFLFFAVALVLPSLRRRLLSSLDDFLGDKMARRMALGVVITAVAVVVVEFVAGRFGPTVKAAQVAQRPKSNIVLISFDALSAEEMSLYGYKRPTTPNIDAFAKKATVFSNFYAGSTFTTPCIGVMLTGAYPSENGVYGLAGQVPRSHADKSLPEVMRSAGYATGGFLTNPWAYYLSKSLVGGFEVLPEPVFHPGGMRYLWALTKPLHQDSGMGSRIAEYFDLEGQWDSWQGHEESPSFRMRPSATFAEARQVLNQLPDGFFLWVHVIAPHHPYLPDPADQGLLIPETEVQSFKEEPWPLWKPHYDLDLQPKVDRRRLAYDEFIMSTDRAFGDFVSDLEKSGRLHNTTVIVSADHGESFEGGVYQHQTPHLTRPVIHIPLIVKTPGQQSARTVTYPGDQTALAPTILDLAGQKKPEWMQGESLAPWLNSETKPQGPGLAFTQYLEKNSVFRPLHHGTLGVIDDQYEYVFYLDTGKGELRPLKEAQAWNVDRSAEEPARTKALHAALHARFPAIVPAR